MQVNTGGGGLAAMAQQMMTQRKQQTQNQTPTSEVKDSAPVQGPKTAKETQRAGMLIGMKSAGMLAKKVENVKTLENKDAIMDRVNVALSKTGTGIKVEAESRLKTVGRTILKGLGSLLSMVINAPILLAKVAMNIIVRPIGLLIAGIHGAATGKGFCKGAGEFNEAFKETINANMDKAMKAVNEKFGDWGASDAVQHSADEISGAMGFNLEGMAALDEGNNFGLVNNGMGDQALDLGMTTAVKGGVEALGNFVDALDERAEGQTLKDTGIQNLTDAAAAINIAKTMQNDLAGQAKRLMQLHSQGKLNDTELAEGTKMIAKQQTMLSESLAKLNHLTGGGEFLVGLGEDKISEANTKLAGSLLDMTNAGNSITNLLAGSDRYAQPLFGGSAQTVGTVTQVAGSGLTLVTSLYEARQEHKIQKASEANASTAAEFRGKMGDQIKTDSAKVVDTVKQFERNNIETAKTSKITKWLKAAVAVAAAAMIVATFVAVAITPVGWAIAGAALAVSIGVGAYKAYKSLRNDSRVESLQTAKNQVAEARSKAADENQAINALAKKPVSQQSLASVTTMLKNITLTPPLTQAQKDEIEAAETLNDPNLLPTLTDEQTNNLNVRFAANVVQIRHLDEAANEIDGALRQMDPSTAASDLIQIANTREPNSEKFTPEALEAQAALKDVFKLPPAAFMTEIDRDDTGKPKLDADGKFQLKPLGGPEAFKAGVELLKEKLSMFSTKATDYDKVVKPEKQSAFFKNRALIN